jgi:deoxyribodipyrimidine photo-lyase
MKREMSSIHFVNGDGALARRCDNPAMTSLFWLRTDLRIQDNPALSAALAAGPAIAAFVTAPEQWRRHGDAPAKIDFWHRNLGQLRDDLAALNIPLKFIPVLEWAEAPAALSAFCRRHGIASVHANAEWGINERRRDDAVAARLGSDDIGWTPHQGATLLAPGSVATGKGDCYKSSPRSRGSAANG